jgi:hypothetical protein
MSQGYLVIATATTGLFSDDYRPHLLEIGAAVIVPEKNVVAGEGEFRFSSLVAQPEGALRDTRAVQAERFHGITPDLVRVAPLEGEVAEAFRHWRSTIALTLHEAGVVLVGWTAFNRPFVGEMLQAREWQEALGGFTVPGPCIMDQATPVMGEAGLTGVNRDGSYRFSSLQATYAHLKDEGHTLHGGWAPGPPSGRALENALAAAYCGVVLAQLPSPIEQAPEKRVEDAT